MKISLNTMRIVNQIYGSAGEPAVEGVTALVRRIGAQLGAVEEVIQTDRYKNIVIAEIIDKKDHPNADKLGVYQARIGGEGHVQVVCGDKNLEIGDKVAWTQPGATVPSTYDKDPFVIEARPLRGEMSHGMFGSGAELLINDDHSRVIRLDTDAAPGTPFDEAYNLKGEAIIDIENKMFTHRPDCFGFIGVAREIEGIHGRPYKSPAWYTPSPDFPDIEADPLPVEVRNDLPQLVPRFTAIALRGVTIKPSPVWLQLYLTSVGVRTINNIVDYANYFMLETGQPLHAYDYDKVKALSNADHAVLGVRHPRPGEKIKLLSGKEIEPRAEAILITTDHRAIGIGGVMGGSETEVDERTRNIIIESATFDMYAIRRTAMAHGLFTDAVTRFSKGQSPLQTLTVLAKIVDEIRRYAGGKVASQPIDDNHLSVEVLERGSLHPSIKTSRAFINARLGLDLSAHDMAMLLKNVEFQVEVHGEDLTITAPFWRADIEIAEDLVEEVSRLYGYEHLPVELPKRPVKPAPHDNLLRLKTNLRNTLASAGANEVLTYSFVHGNLLDKATQDKTKAFQLANALSPDLHYYRVSLTPSLLEKVHSNLKAGHSEFALFELGKAHVKGEPDPSDPAVPKEVNALSLVFAADEKAADTYGGTPYFQARKYLDHILGSTAQNLPLEPLEHADLYKNPWLEQMTAPYDPKRSAVLRDAVGLLPGTKGLIWGVVGEFKPSVRKAPKLPDFAAGFELDPLLFLNQANTPYVPLSRYPTVQQDLSLRVPQEVTYQSIILFFWGEYAARHSADDISSLQAVDLYQPDGQNYKHVTLRFSLTSPKRTLTSAEVNTLLDTIANAAKDKFGAERIGHA